MVQPDPMSRPMVQFGVGQMYPARITQIRRKLDEIFGVADGTLNMVAHTYGSDQSIWNWIAILPTVGGAVGLHWTCELDRSARMLDAPYAGMMTIQRRATNVPGLNPAVKIFVEDDLVFGQSW